MNHPLSRRNSETEDLIAMRDAFRNGSAAEKRDASAWLAKRDARMAEMQRETRTAPPVTEVRTLTDDEQHERDLALALEIMQRRDFEYGADINLAVDFA